LYEIAEIAETMNDLLLKAPQGTEAYDATFPEFQAYAEESQRG
jgi:hypothetical protein